MSSDSLTLFLPYLTMVGLGDVMLLYASYLSLSVWRGLAVPIYRSRALWMALFGIPFVVVYTYTSAVSAVLPYDSPFAATILRDLLFEIPIITLFVWIDRMVGSVIHLDYLRRDVLSWKRLRLVYWAFVVVSQTVFWSRYASPIAPSEGLASALTLVPLAYGSLCLAIGARTTSDMTFKSHVKWFGYLGVAGIPIVIIFGLTNNSILGSLPIPLLCFCFYKMARFLVPVGKLTTDQQEIPSSTLPKRENGILNPSAMKSFYEVGYRYFRMPGTLVYVRTHKVALVESVPLNKISLEQ